VLGHELNNSLAPIQSIAGQPARTLGRDASSRRPDFREDLRQGLAVIASRAEALSRFTSAYARLAKLPPPRAEPVAVHQLVARVVSLETGSPVGVIPGPQLVVDADPDQLGAAPDHRAAQRRRRGARDARRSSPAGWRRAGGRVEIWIADDGPGLPSTGQPVRAVLSPRSPAAPASGLVLSQRGDRGERTAARSLSREPSRPPRAPSARLFLPL
jgi:nitrogen fixation/metabolism regulation signal transduction histidine kinase